MSIIRALMKWVTGNGIYLALIFPLISIAANDDVKIDTKGKLKFTSDDKQFTYQLGGRIHLDLAYYNEDMRELRNGAELRRARLFIQGTMDKHWFYKAQYGFDGNAAKVYDAFLGYSGFAQTKFKIGHMKPNNGFDYNTSTKYGAFIERSLPALAFGSPRRIGFDVQHWRDNVAFHAGLYLDKEDNDSAGGDENLTVSGRLIFAPWHKKGSALHLGASFLQGNPRDGASHRLRVRPEAHVDDNRLIDTGKSADVNDYLNLGIEFAWVNGAFSVQTEYISQKWNRNNSSDVRFDGWYITGSYFLTGESRPYKYKTGSFGRLKPKGNGAWQLALRVSSLDLDDDDIMGGDEDNITLGLNYYVSKQLRFMANYVNVNSEKNSVDDDPDIFEVRVSFDF